MARRKPLKIQDQHIHMVLWNLKAARNNARFAPEGSGWRTEAPRQIQEGEDELRRRSFPIPGQSMTEEEWTRLLEWAVALPHDVSDDELPSWIQG